MLTRKETYEQGIYIKNIKNIVDFDTENYAQEQNIDYIANIGNEAKIKNEILVSKVKHNK